LPNEGAAEKRAIIKPTIIYSNTVLAKLQKQRVRQRNGLSVAPFTLIRYDVSVVSSVFRLLAVIILIDIFILPVFDITPIGIEPSASGIVNLYAKPMAWRLVGQ
jgi:hypothetical protein